MTLANEIQPDPAKCVECGAEYFHDLQNAPCELCQENAKHKAEDLKIRKARLILMLGGELPLKENTFGAFIAAAGTKLGLEKCWNFNPSVNNLYLFGGVGVGKTHLSNAIAIRAELESGQTVESMTPHQLSRSLTGKKYDNRESVIARVSRADVLVLDDLGRKKESEDLLDCLCEILDRRRNSYKNGLVVTSNLAPAALAQTISDDRLCSRLFGMCIPVRLEGPDFRTTSMKIQLGIGGTKVESQLPLPKIPRDFKTAATGEKG